MAILQKKFHRLIFSNFSDSMYRGILIPYCIFSRNPFCLICIHNTTEVARLLALTYYLPLFNSQLLNKNHAANLIAKFLLTRSLRDATAIFSALSLHSTMSLLNPVSRQNINCPSLIFTFHDVSIKSLIESLNNSQFTFLYIPQCLY